MKEIKFNLQYMIRKKEFYFAILSILFINIVHVLFVVYNVIKNNGFIENTASAEYLSILYNPFVNFNVLNIILFPIICSMIFSDSNWLEDTMKTTNMLHTRINSKKNIIVRFILAFFVTVVITFIGFLVNYLLLRILFSSGNQVSYFVELGFFRILREHWFLESVKYVNPVIFVLLINLSVSIVLGVLSSFSYACSFFVKNRIVLYFVPFIYIIVNELFFILIRLKEFSIVQKLQPFEIYSLINYFVAIGITILLALGLLVYKFRKKDCVI